MNNQVTIDGQRGTIQADGMVRFGSDDTVNVLFYNKSVLDPVQSREKGRPFHISLPYVRIQQPGEKDYIDRPVAENDMAKHRWPHHWARFENGQKPAPAGTPLECLFPQSPEIAANLHTMAVHTVEQLAGLTAHGMQTIGMGAAEWQRKAKEFLAAANGGKGMHHLAGENEKLRSQMEVQANQIAALKTQLDRLLAAQKQGIPAAMIPNGAPTLAQEYAAAAPMFKQTFENDELPDAPPAEEYAAPTEAMFIEAPEEPEEIVAAPMEQPRRGGWPKGKPRTPRI